jgi:phosphate transport system substrate-binding protein
VSKLRHYVQTIDNGRLKGFELVEEISTMTAKSWLALLCGWLLLVGAAKADPSGGGSSAIYPVMSLWAQDYKLRSGVAVNYQPIGSGGGIRQSLSRTIDFGNTDIPLAAADLARGKLVQFPVLFIAIVPVVNLPGVAPGALTLDGPTLADIYLGKITRWDAPQIAHLNPGMRLPKIPVIVVHRSDASGTTWHFTSYLAAANAGWKRAAGVGTAVAWPIGSAAQGNAGVVTVLERTKGAIGYVEYAYAQQSHLTFASLVNREGTRVAPSMISFRAAAAVADFRNRLSPIPANPPGQASWPLTAATYMLLHTDASPELNRQVVRFLDYALHDGRALAERLSYVPLPEPVVGEVQGGWATELKLHP